MTERMRELENSNEKMQDENGKLTKKNEAEICNLISMEFDGREFEEHDITQVKKSLEGEGKEITQETLSEDMRDYARKTG
ncbi:hypothetical protein KA013_01255 [Patescibacteria group bacterium]|nr:hypothetical protein [Patescibacteria group bacterium]